MTAITENSPELWAGKLPLPDSASHKYDRGHALIFGAARLTGATRLAATACSRIGTGLVSVHASEKADIYRATLPADIMVSEDDPSNVRKVTAVLAGPGGIGPVQRDLVFANPWKAARILDAGSLPNKKEMGYLDERCILTPHEGEFSQCFGTLDGERSERAVLAAEKSGAIIVLKGAETVIAAPDGMIVINRHASPYLAKAGTGDVLAGIISGLVAQGMGCFDAACAGVWIHGDAGIRFGIGLVASDLEGTIPAILKALSNR